MSLEEGGGQVRVPMSGTCLEDDLVFVAKQVARSVERVSLWLALLECAVPLGEDGLEP